MARFSYIFNEPNEDCPDYGGIISVDYLHDERKHICQVGNSICSERCRIRRSVFKI